MVSSSYRVLHLTKVHSQALNQHMQIVGMLIVNEQDTKRTIRSSPYDVLAEKTFPGTSPGR
jgi:hypothetical protein